MTKRKPFHSWRLLAQSGSRRWAIDTDDKEGIEGLLPPLPPFDELVIRDAPAVHLERMDTRHLHIQIGDVTLSAWVDRAGKTRLRLIDGKFVPRTWDIVPLDDGELVRGVRSKRGKR